MFLRLAFAVAVHSEPDIFLVDEILAVGDEPFQRKCIRRIRELKAQGQTLMVVSHDLNMIQRICDRGIALDHGVVVPRRPRQRREVPARDSSEAGHVGSGSIHLGGTEEGFLGNGFAAVGPPQAALPPPQEAALASTPLVHRTQSAALDR